MATYEQIAKDLQPPFLRGARWLAFVGAIGAQIEVESVRAQEAARAGVIEEAPVDALPYLGADRKLPRYPSESDAVYRARLGQTFTAWRKSGTKNGLLDQLNAAFPGPIWGTLEYLESPGDFAPSTYWSQFDVLCDANGFIEQWEIGDDHVIGEEGLIIGATLTPSEYALIKQVILDWKPKYTLCRYFVIDFGVGGIVNFPIQEALIP